MTLFLEKIKRFILEHSLLSSDSLYLVALSGGADSVALLLALKALGYRVEACHCNFHLRGEESMRDEHFCESLCQKEGVPLHRIHFDTREYAQLHKESIEMAARNLRYRYFAQLREDIGAEGVCVAHHKDDCAETVLINLVRGTGLGGLKGILPKNGTILRPMLCTTRQEILDFLADRNQDFVTDSSNLVDDVMRNKIRLNILPLLKEMNPSVVDNIVHTAEYVQQAGEVLEDVFGGMVKASEKGDWLEIDKERIRQCKSPEYALFQVLSPYGFHGAVINEVLQAIDRNGKTWNSVSHQLVIDRSHLLLRPLLPSSLPLCCKLPEEGNYRIDEDRKIAAKVYDKQCGFVPSSEPMKATLDAGKVHFPLTVRHPEPGDRFRPFGMKGSRLVSDYLTDRKYNAFMKEATIVIADSTGKIIWIVGERISEETKVDAMTKQILEITIQYKQ